MLPVAMPWFRTSVIAPGLIRIDEPHAHLMVAANIWHLRGTERDLVFDTGLGVGSLRAECPELFERDPIVVLSHAHLDHVGGAHEFAACAAGRAEDFTDIVATLDGAGFGHGLGLTAADWEPDGVPDLMIDALPASGYRPENYRIQPPRITRWLAEGDTIDIGGTRLTVLELPGHTPGSIALLDETAGMLLSGDVVYDDLLLDTTVGANRADYATSLTRLAAMPIAVVHPGHGESFDADRLAQIVADYLASA